MDKRRALYGAVHGYKPGTDSLAAAMVPPMSATTLRHKVMPNDLKQFLSPEEGIQVQQITGDHGALQVEARELGYVLLRRPVLSSGPLSLTKANDAIKEFSEFLSAATAGLAGGAITGNRLRQIEAECLEAIAAIQDLMAHIQGLHEAGQPTSGRGAV
jgi:hypothetical protein